MILVSFKPNSFAYYYDERSKRPMNPSGAVSGCRAGFARR